MSALVHSAQLVMNKTGLFFRRHFLFILLTTIIFTGLEEYLLSLLREAAEVGSESVGVRLIFALQGLIVGVLYAFFVPAGLFYPEKSSLEILKLIGDKTMPLTIEGLRMLVPILLGYLLILPGVYFQLLYTFVFFIVLFDPRYESDPEFDALKASKALAKVVLGPLFILLFLSSAVELIMTFWGGQSSFMERPVWSLLLTLAGVVTDFAFPALAFGLYDYMTKRGGENERNF